MNKTEKIGTVIFVVYENMDNIFFRKRWKKDQLNDKWINLFQLSIDFFLVPNFIKVFSIQVSFARIKLSLPHNE